MEKLSIILPVYNQENFLKDTIESVLNQSFKNFEFLILDDGSTDGSANIINHYSAKDHRIKAFFEKNSGKCAATNKLVEMATGDLCAFMDADDIMMPKRLEQQLQFHTMHPQIAASSSHCYYIDANGNTMGNQKYPFLRNIEECERSFLQNEIIHCAFTGLMMKRNIFLKVGGLDPKFWPCEDLDLANKIIEKGHLLVIIQEFLMQYRIHDSSITASRQWHMFDMSAYTRFCISQRRGGKPICTFKEFISKQHNIGWKQKLWENSYRHSQVLHKKAGFAFYKGNYWRFLSKFLLAFIIRPDYIIATLRNRYNFKFRWTSNALKAD
ncbi:glycosyltransferase [Antarcticibacterium flavum]|uniref:Glycosyltransferase n=1 Tax=Antarcticibacterium flavum TaxID=2058175 RepID=A0A5B7WXW3_9FLAO|nr:MULTISPECIES: glycosyltransferase [Antarcticibacterium]MCM4160818.1 hypothetical protein [Antarcticibacterium sp. W02-3]QCY67986.1 glycosyltransferase [Antarcticibacterium flavum]